MQLRIDPQTIENMLVCLVDEQNNIQAMATTKETARMIEAAPKMHSALRSFPQATQHNLCSTATIKEMQDYIGKVLTWANHIRGIL